MKRIDFDKDNPYSKYYSYGILNDSENAIGLYIEDKFYRVEGYDRYLTSVTKRRLLTLAEYDAELRFRHSKPIM